MITLSKDAFDGPIWEGIYGSFADVPSSGNNFETDDWLISCRRQLAEIKLAGCRYQEYLLPVVGALIVAEHKYSFDPLVVLDIGGGAGNAYPSLRAAMPSGGISFHVVENEEVCVMGREEFTGNREVTFHTEIPELLQIDIVHFGSVIQYVDDWRSFVKQASVLNPKYILFSDAFAGDIDTFITAQNFYGAKLPCRFLSLSELVDFVESQNMRLVFDAEYDRTMLGKRDPLPLEALPEKYQLKYTHHLLFKKNDVQSVQWRF